ncbi:MAG: GTPase [Desulfobacteraceae bacterium]|nr:MAG: GTPase [Desulfobacteraceae bacterium]
MVEFNQEGKKIVIKLVYYGPALSGKTTNLMRLHDFLAGRQCGELMSLETKGDRTLFFDLLPLAVRLDSGFTLKFKLFTVPGQVAHDATRKAVLSRADGVVFVADSQSTQAVSNFESFDNLEKNANRVGLDFDHMPLVVQFNKRDLPDIVAEQEILNRWSPSGLPITFGAALQGRGVRETFQRLLSETYRCLDERHRLRETYGLEPAHFMQVLC